jgi:hypothetical protein
MCVLTFVYIFLFSLAFKGTVSRDFQSLLFFPNQPLKGHIIKNCNDSRPQATGFVMCCQLWVCLFGVFHTSQSDSQCIVTIVFSTPLILTLYGVSTPLSDSKECSTPLCLTHGMSPPLSQTERFDQHLWVWQLSVLNISYSNSPVYCQLRIRLHGVFRTSVWLYDAFHALLGAWLGGVPLESWANPRVPLC